MTILSQNEFWNIVNYLHSDYTQLQPFVRKTMVKKFLELIQDEDVVVDRIRLNEFDTELQYILLDQLIRESKGLPLDDRVLEVAMNKFDEINWEEK